MIGKLKGRIDERNEDSLILDVNGVGYEVFCASRTLAALEPGTAAELVIETHVREDHIHLYGFESATDREWFRLLLTVQGVGVKMALALLSAFTTAQLTQTIAAQDSTALTRVSGVGPKLATRLITELKNKVAKMPVSGAASIVTLPAKGKKGKATAPLAVTVSEDAVSALVNLGYGRSEAFAAVATAMRDSEQLDDVIRHSLKELAR